MEKSNNSSGAVVDYSCEPKQFDLNIFFANLSEQELNQLVEQRHSAFGDGPKKQQTGLCQPLEVSNGGNFRGKFSAIWRQ